MRRFLSTYAKNRVIASSYSVPNAIRNLIESDFATYHTDKRTDNYHEVKFASYISRQMKPDMADWSDAEKERFSQAQELYQQFEQVDDLVSRLGSFKRDLFTIYSEIGREAGVPSIFGHNETSTTETVDEIKRALNDYSSIMSQIQDPEWKEKIGEELGYYLHLLYNEHSMSDHKHMFEQFDLQTYFK